MRYLVLIVFLASYVGAQPCVIAKQHKRNVNETLSRWTTPKPYDWVEGDFPDGMKFQTEIGKKDVQKLKDKGAKFIILKQDYSLDELNDAREQCNTEAKAQ